MNSPEELFRKLYPNKPIPGWAHQRIKEAPNFDVVETKPAYVPLARLVGTDHQRYSGSTWLEALDNLKRGEYDAQRIEGIDYWVLNKLPKGQIRNEPVRLLYIQEENLYYTLGGNHRMLLVKLRGDETVCIKNVVYGRKRLPPPELPPVKVQADTQFTWLDNIIGCN